MSDNRFRRQRLLSVLPRIFAAPQEGSMLSGLIDMMATSLADLDGALTRTQRDHWLPFADGNRAGDDAPSALERLGDLLDIARLPGEETENYRQRLKLTAPILMRGLTTPRSLLELAIVTLGAEPCPKRLTVKDATLAFGLPPGSCKKCPACANLNADCPNAQHRALEVSLTENPPQQRQYQPAAPLVPGQRFRIISDSLTEDVPQVRLQALDKDIRYPILQNIATGEVMLFVGVIKVGEVLNVQPEVTAAEDAQFDSYTNVDAHAWQTQNRSGSAFLVDKKGKARSVKRFIYSLNGKVFPPDDVTEDAPDAPRFAGNRDTEGVRFADALNVGDTFDGTAKFVGDNAQKTGAIFGGASQIIRAPRILNGENEWLYGTYDKQDIRAIAGALTGDLYDNAPEQKEPHQALLSLSWWIRPPATFQVRIPRNAWVADAEKRGATQLFSRWLQQAKAVGVRALLDYPESPLREIQPADEAAFNIQVAQSWQDSHLLSEADLSWELVSQLAEQHALSEGEPVWSGVFEQTRFDYSSCI